MLGLEAFSDTSTDLVDLTDRLEEPVAFFLTRLAFSSMLGAASIGGEDGRRAGIWGLGGMAGRSSALDDAALGLWSCPTILAGPNVPAPPATDIAPSAADL